MSANQLAVVQQVIVSEEMQRQLKTLLPPSVKLDKFTEVTIAAIQNSPEVLEADKDSLYRSCLAAARRGLLPDKREGALVIYKTNVGTKQQPRWVPMVQFLPMVEGIIKEMAKAGIKAYAVSVYGNDVIDLWNDDQGQHVTHRPNPFGDRGQMVGVFAAAMTADGRPYVEPMNLADIDRVARRSKQCYIDEKTGQLVLGGTWKSDFERMAQKSALHRVRKRLPITDEDSLQNLRDMEEETDIDVSSEERSSASGTGSTSPSTQANPSLPPPDTKHDEVLKPTAKPRRSRVLQGVVAQEQEKQNATAGASRTGEASVHTGSEASRPSPQQPSNGSPSMRGDVPTAGRPGAESTAAPSQKAATAAPVSRSAQPAAANIGRAKAVAALQPTVQEEYDERDIV